MRPFSPGIADFCGIGCAGFVGMSVADDDVTDDVNVTGFSLEGSRLLGFGTDSLDCGLEAALLSKTGSFISGL